MNLGVVDFTRRGGGLVVGCERWLLTFEVGSQSSEAHFYQPATAILNLGGFRGERSYSAVTQQPSTHLNFSAMQYLLLTLPATAHLFLTNF